MKNFKKGSSTRFFLILKKLVFIIIYVVLWEIRMKRDYTVVANRNKKYIWNFFTSLWIFSCVSWVRNFQLSLLKIVSSLKNGNWNDGKKKRIWLNVGTRLRCGEGKSKFMSRKVLQYICRRFYGRFYRNENDAFFMNVEKPLNFFFSL